MTPLLDIQDLSVEYFQRGTTVHALRKVSFGVAPGEVLGIVGESGSGKTTIALAILRLIRPQEGRVTEGKILFDGRDLRALPDGALRALRGQQIAIIFQDPFTALNPVLKIHVQMAEVLRTRGPGAAVGTVREKSEDSVLAHALEQVQLEPSRTLRAYPHQLSGGQRQRVLIATALLGMPALILADEPTTALDVIVQKEILDLLATLQQAKGFAMILISHNLAVVGQYARRTAIMKAGEIVEIGPTSEVLTHPQHPYARQLVAAVPRF